MVAHPVTREEAVRLLSEAGVPLNWPDSYALPISRVELTRRVLGFCRERGGDFAAWDAPLMPAFDDLEDVEVLMALEEAFDIGLPDTEWTESDPRTFGDLMLFVEQQLHRCWNSRLTNVPGGCESQSVFYTVRRMLGEAMAYRARPADPLPPAFRAAEPLCRALWRRYGVSLPQERRVFGRLPITPTWFVLWLAVSAWLLSLIPATDTLWLTLFAMLPVLVVVHALSRPVWPGEFRTFGDVVRFVVAEHARNHERMRLALRRADA
jgi:hypothetical protein